MKVEVSEFNQGGISFTFHPSFSEIAIAGRRKYRRKSYLKTGATLPAPQGFSLRKTHPDLLTLGILLLSFPYVTSKVL